MPHFGDDRLRSFVDGLRRIRVGVLELASDALGGELDGCEWILDLVRDAARRLVPCCELLGLYELRGVLHGQDPSFFCAEAGHSQLEITELTAANERHFTRAHAARGQLVKGVVKQG